MTSAETDKADEVDEVMNLQRLGGDGEVVGRAKQQHESTKAKKEKTYLKSEPHYDRLTNEGVSPCYWLDVIS